MEPKSYWDEVYASKSPDAVSWYAPRLRESLAYIKRTQLPASARIIDVGGGEATLVDDLLDAGYSNVSVLDISANAIQVCKQRLGARKADVNWYIADVLEQQFETASFDVWHDRAVFHFLTSDE